MWRPQKAANVTNPHTEDLQEKREGENQREREPERERERDMLERGN